MLGGLLGVAFNLFSLVIMKLRIRYVKQPFKRVTEVSIYLESIMNLI